MTLHSCLYRGSVMHRRLRPTSHRFRYRAFWLLLNLDEIPALSARLRLFSHNRFNLFALYDNDHGDGSATPLRAQIERQLGQAGIDLSGGPIQLFCMPRTLGYSFNPLSLYFCYRDSGQLAAIVYQVHNTFGERHAYVAAVDADDASIRHECTKTFYVSPFMAMNQTYHFRLNLPDRHFALGINTREGAEVMLSACLAASRQSLSDWTLSRNFLGIPLVTTKVILAIHWQAVRLWLKGMRIRERPKRSANGMTLAAGSPKQRTNSHAH